MLAWIYFEKFDNGNTSSKYILDNASNELEKTYKLFLLQQGKNANPSDTLAIKSLVALEYVNDYFKTQFVQRVLGIDSQEAYNKLALKAPSPLPTIFFTGNFYFCYSISANSFCIICSREDGRGH